MTSASTQDKMLMEKLYAEQKKLYAEQKHAQDNAINAMTAGAIGIGKLWDEPVRESLRRRLEHTIERASRDLQKAESSRELAVLLDKNPDIARILHLLECLGEFNGRLS